MELLGVTAKITDIEKRLKKSIQSFTGVNGSFYDIDIDSFFEDLSPLSDELDELIAIIYIYQKKYYKNK